MFELGSLLGKGSDGTVYELLSPNDDKSKYVVKYIQPKVYGIENYLEYYIMWHLTNPNIVKAKDICLSKSNLIKIIQEKAISDLFSYKFTSENKKNIIFQIVNAVKFLHGFDIVHGDIKPSNILIFEDNNVKLSDFSLCRFVSDIGVTKQLYTYHFRPPEVDKGTIKRNSDIYALGCTLYEIYFNFPYFNKKSNIRVHLPTKKEEKHQLFMDLINNMIVEDYNERFKIEDVCNHNFFKGYEFLDSKDISMTKEEHVRNIKNFAKNKNIKNQNTFINKCLNITLENCRNFENMDNKVVNDLKYDIFGYYFKK